MTAPEWSPSQDQERQYTTDGYFIHRGLLDRDTVMQIKGAILDRVLQPTVGETIRADADPMDPMNADDEAARVARFRKLGAVGVSSPLIWSSFYLNKKLMAVARFFLGEDIVMKFNSCFLKPARTGSSTPWHQDNGLWRDGDREAVNVWMAVDPATRENGCLQFIPGSHEPDVVHTHVLYPDSIHGELPRDVVSEALETHGVHHIELDPGDAVFWHSNLFHYSPPNTSEKGRIGIAGVFSSVESALANPTHRHHRWCVRGGDIVPTFPPETVEGYRAEQIKPPPYPKAG